jgi:photosystem II stability/assembly factor-like uncharacterized protein
MIVAGTKDGLFRFVSRDGVWEALEPVLAGYGVSHAVQDRRQGRFWAAANNGHAAIMRSDDAGGTWRQVGDHLPGELAWHVVPGRADRPDEVYAGVMPAALYRSRNGGDTWEPVLGLNQHETQPEWVGGGGGLCLHTIVVDEQRSGRIYAGISAAGLFRSDDDGENWRPVNEGITSFACEFEAELGMTVKHRSVHRCVHKVVQHPSQPDVLIQQNHIGVYRSVDAGETWTEITGSLPSRFGFPIAITGGEQPAIFVIPQHEETLRTEGRLAVWRSDDLGDSWRMTSDGLPEGEHNVLRDAMSADPGAAATVAFGTTAGELYLSTDGETWQRIADGLPRVLSVRFAEMPA